jgi:hypothetical protein
LASVFCCFSAPRWLSRADGRHGRATGAQGQHPARTPFTPGPRRTHGGTAAAKGRHGTERGRREAGYPRHPSGTLMEVRSPWRTTVPPPRVAIPSRHQRLAVVAGLHVLSSPAFIRPGTGRFSGGRRPLRAAHATGMALCPVVRPGHVLSGRPRRPHRTPANHTDA